MLHNFILPISFPIIPSFHKNLILTNVMRSYSSYDNIVQWYDYTRSRELFEKSYLDKCINLVCDNPKVLDIGCGMGEPIGKYIIEQNLDYSGIDSCEGLINIAKQRFPSHDFIVGDMRTLNLRTNFDFLICWNSLFHLNHEEQKHMFKTLSKHCSNGAILLFTSGPDKGEIWSDNGGEMLYHSSLSPNDYKELLAINCFDIIEHSIEDINCGNSTIWICQHNTMNYL